MSAGFAVAAAACSQSFDGLMHSHMVLGCTMSPWRWAHVAMLSVDWILLQLRANEDNQVWAQLNWGPSQVTNSCLCGPIDNR